MNAVTVHPAVLVILVLVGPAAILAIVLAKNWSRMGEILMLAFRRPRVVCARMHTVNNTAIDHFCVPGERGMFEYNGGVYHFPANAERGTRYNVPVADFVELQIAAEPGDLVLSTRKFRVKVMKEDGSITQETKELPQALIKHSGLQPVLLKLCRRDEHGELLEDDEPPVTATEVADMLDSRIVQEINAATVEDDKREKATRLILIMLIAAVLIVGLVLYGKLGNLEGHLQALENTAAAATTAARGA